MIMRRTLPDVIKSRTASEKIVWMYIDRYPGQHSVRSLEAALGITAGRALPSLVKDGLLIEESPAAGIKPGTYRVADLKAKKAEPEEKKAS